MPGHSPSRRRNSTRAPWRSRRSRFSATVVGCGLIGASMALALRRRWPAVTVVGCDRAPVLRRATARRIVDRTVSLRTLPRHLTRDDIDLVVLAMPVDAVVQRLPNLARALLEREPMQRPLVMDVGSVKTPVVDAAEQSQCPRFVGGHPMAGSEHPGLDHADAAMFDDRRFVLCPSSGATRADREAAQTLVLGLGAEAIEVRPDVHDRCVALISHAPHLVALAMMNAGVQLRATLPSSQRDDLPWRLAAGSWRDATRVAAADPRLWAAIFEHNAEAIVEALDEIMAALQRLRDGLADGGAARLDDPRHGVDARALARQRRRIGRYLP